jgi:hypothetical protein
VPPSDEPHLRTGGREVTVRAVAAGLRESRERAWLSRYHGRGSMGWTREKKGVFSFARYRPRHPEIPKWPLGSSHRAGILARVVVRPSYSTSGFHFPCAVRPRHVLPHFAGRPARVFPCFTCHPLTAKLFTHPMQASGRVHSRRPPHSFPRLTMNRYTRALMHNLGAAVEKLPTMGPTAPPSEPAALRATGTDGGIRLDAVPGDNGRSRLRTAEDKDGPNAEPGGSRLGGENLRFPRDLRAIRCL